MLVITFIVASTHPDTRERAPQSPAPGPWPLDKADGMTDNVA